MYGFLDEAPNQLGHQQNDAGIDPLSDGLGSRNMYGSPFRDINHAIPRTEDEL